MNTMRELKEELKKTSAGRQFLEEAEPEKQTDNLIEFAKEQCEIFPEDSYMGKYLRETIKILQAEPCEDAVSREDVIKAIDRHTFNTDDGLCLDEDITIILEELPQKQEFCEDCVSRKSLKHKLQERHDFFVDAYGGFINLPQKDKARVDAITNCIAMVVNEPPVKPTRKKGKWIKSNIGGAKVCSICQAHMGLSNFNYCPNCGAKMGSEEE